METIQPSLSGSYEQALSGHKFYDCLLLYACLAKLKMTEANSCYFWAMLEPRLHKLSGECEIYIDEPA